MNESAAAWRALAISSLGSILVMFNSTATNIALGSIGDSFPDAGPGTRAWVVSGFFIGLASLMPMGGRLGDRVGRKRVFQIGVAIFVVTGVLSAIAPSIWLLIAARTLQGLGGALIVPTSLALVLPMFEKAKQARAVSVWSAAGPLAAAAAPAVSALVLTIADWRWLYAATAPIGAVLIAAGSRVLVETKAERVEGRLDFAGVAIGTASIAFVVFAVTQSPKWGLLHPGTVSALVFGLLLVPVFVVRSKSHPTPLMNLHLFRIPSVATANVANFLISITSLSIWLAWPLWLSRVWNYDTLGLGVALVLGPISAGTSTIVAGRLADRFGRRTMLLLGPWFMFAAVTWQFWRLSEEVAYWTDLAPGLILFGMGWGMTIPPLNGWTLEQVTQDNWGEVNAAFNTGRNVAAAIGSAAVVGLIGDADRIDRMAAYDRTWIFFVFWVVAGGVVLWGKLIGQRSVPISG